MSQYGNWVEQDAPMPEDEITKVLRENASQVCEALGKPEAIKDVVYTLNQPVEDYFKSQWVVTL